MVIELFDIDRSLIAPKYYRFSHEPSSVHNGLIPWGMSCTTGVNIDPYGKPREDKPIFFVNYYGSTSRNAFARQPLSVGTLLETRAIASEINAIMTAISFFPNDGERSVEMTLINNEFRDMCYNRELIEYNTAAHFLSQTAKISDIFETYKISSMIAYIALNLKNGDFPKIKMPNEFSNVKKRAKYFQRQRDRGYAFAAMIYNGGIYNGNTEEYVNKCVKESGLGDLECILKSASEFLEREILHSKDNHKYNKYYSTVNHFRREGKFGKNICDILSALPSYSLTIEAIFNEFKEICPPIMDSEGEFIQFSKGRIDTYCPENMHDAAHELNEFTRNLLSGCRGI
ncbi:hypothetical protein GCM10027396_08510 [Insolitispirillum peregrinum]